MIDNLSVAASTVALIILGLLMFHGVMHILNKDRDIAAACAQSICPEPMKPVMIYRQGCVCVALPVTPTQGDHP